MLTTMQSAILYIDDDHNDDASQRIKNELPNCELILPPKDITEIDGEYGLFISDYDLAVEHVHYSGITLITQLREKYFDKPIILFTRENIWDSRHHPKKPESSNTDCDLVIYKSDFQKDPEIYKKRIFSLMEGFHQLQLLDNDDNDSWDTIQNLLNAQDEELIDLKKASPPNKRGYWLITETAEWIRNVILNFPGILVDELYASILLGITLQEFRANDKISKLFVQARYDGIFREFGERWWRSRIEKIAYNLLREADINLPVNIGFHQAYQKLYGRQLELAVCNWDQTPIADTICYIDKEPVKYQHSLPYYPDDRPLIMLEARVSRVAITGTSKLKDYLLDPTHVEIAEEWRDEAEREY